MLTDRSLLRHPMSVTTLCSAPTQSEAPQLWMGNVSLPHVSTVQSSSRHGRSWGASASSNRTTRTNAPCRHLIVGSKPVKAS